MQSLVMDVNAALTVYRNNFLAARRARDSAMCETAIYGSNALLEPEYRLIFDTQAHEAAGYLSYVIQCARCGRTTTLSKDRIKCDVIDTIAGSVLFKYVECMQTVRGKRCGNFIELNPRNIIEEVNDDLDSVYAPEMPKANSIFDRVYAYGAYWKWVDETWTLLEKQHQKLRSSVSAKDEAEEAEAQ